VSGQNAPRVGFVGLGNMGGRMTRRLVDAGIPVLGYDVRSELAAEVGAAAAATVADVARGSDVILLSLPNTSVVESVVLGEGGLLPNASGGQIIVDLSTSAPSSTIALHERFAERGAEYVDAGISGGAAAAEKGALTIMAGGSKSALDAIDWVLAPIAAKVFHMGAPGAGHSAKVLNNFLNAVSLAATAEVMVAAKKAGLDLTTLLDVLNSSSGVNFATLNRFPNIVRGNYMEGGLSGTLMLKDINLYVDYVSSLGVPALNASGPLATFGLSNGLGYADKISNRVVDAIGDVSGAVRLFVEPGAEGEGQ
jgi:3-hydroxyisobutyrate dehydrogenase